jgi:hypothetical protein
VKVYFGNLDGRNFALLTADSKAHAMRLLEAVGYRIGRRVFDDFFSETGNVEDCATARAQPYTVFKRADMFRGEWKAAKR